MIDRFESVTGWAAGTDTANIALETTTVREGAGALAFDKTGTSSTSSFVVKKLGVPIDIQEFRAGYTLKLDHYLADYVAADINSVTVRLIYRYDSSGAADRYEDFSDLRSDGAYTDADWNTLSVDLNNPTAASGTPPTDAERRFLVSLLIGVTVDDTADTFTDFLVDNLRLVPKTGYSPLAALLFDNCCLPIPTFDEWSPNREDRTQMNKAEAASDSTYLGGDEIIRAGIRQVRHIHDQNSQIHTLEDSLQLFDQWAAANQGWGLAFPAHATLDTTISAASALALSVTLASAIGFDAVGFPMDIRIGPNDSRNVERLRALSRSGTTLYLDRPLRYAHEALTPIRSLGYYPSLAKRGSGNMLQRTGKAVTFNLDAVETA